jgi:hypothetical protein
VEAVVMNCKIGRLRFVYLGPKVLSIKETCGLGVYRLRKFNLTLLGKLCWRLYVDQEELWFKLLAAKYGCKDSSIQSRREGVW